MYVYDAGFCKIHTYKYVYVQRACAKIRIWNFAIKRGTRERASERAWSCPVARAWLKEPLNTIGKSGKSSQWPHEEVRDEDEKCSMFFGPTTSYILYELHVHICKLFLHMYRVRWQKFIKNFIYYDKL